MIKPAGHRVLIRPHNVEEKTESGIIIARQTVEQERLAQIKGTVVDVGPTAWEGFGDGTPWAAIGDTVFYAKYSGMRVKEDENSEELILVNDEDITAVIMRDDENG